jgi:putative ABC transport system ATP-binding protein
MSQSIVQVRNLYKSFSRGAEEIKVLQSLNLDVGAAEFMTLMGPSGSGKTTLLNLIAGLDQPTSGSIIVDNQMISEMSESQLARWRTRNVGFIFQFYYLLPVLTAYENVELPLLLLSLTSSQRKEQVLRALDLVGLTDRMRHKPGQLSGGQQQRVGIARAIVTDPTLIVADEPTGDLDSKSADEILSIMELLRSQLGKTVIMVTHDPHAAERSQRILHLEKGRLAQDTASRPLDVLPAQPSLGVTSHAAHHA